MSLCVSLWRRKKTQIVLLKFRFYFGLSLYDGNSSKITILKMEHSKVLLRSLSKKKSSSDFWNVVCLLINACSWYIYLLVLYFWMEISVRNFLTQRCKNQISTLGPVSFLLVLGRKNSCSLSLSVEMLNSRCTYCNMQSIPKKVNARSREKL